MTIYISVAKTVLKNNKKLGRNDPPFEVRVSKEHPNPSRVHEATFTGRVRLVYDPKNPIPGANAVCWVEIDEDEST